MKGIISTIIFACLALLMSDPALARNKDGGKYIKLTSWKKFKGHHNDQKNLAGQVMIPKYIKITGGRLSTYRTKVSIVIDNNIVCSYESKKSSHHLLYKMSWKNRFLFQECSNSQGPGDLFNVSNNVSLDIEGRVFYVKAEARLKKSNGNNDGGGDDDDFTPPDASEGQMMVFDGSNWVAKDAIEDGSNVGDLLQWDGNKWSSTALNDVVSEGPQGPQGEQGIAGEQGPAGEMGPQGAVGPMGPQGPIGEQGPVGLQGPQGPVGEQGAAGPQGPQGEQGLVGPQGPAGPQGEQGIAGVQGAVGPIGPQGPQGLPGANGADGNVGPQGPQGEQGPAGVAGAAGPQGPQGEQGAIGPAGPQGPQGLQGEQGIAGAQGPQGDQGIAGPQGLQGPIGPQGPAGEQGPQGEAGSDATVSLTAGAGMVPGVIDSTGTIAVNVGVGAGQIPQLDSNGKLPASVMPEGSGGGGSGGGAIQAAVIKDIRPSGTHGGDCISGSYNQRVLNTIEGSSFASFAAPNQFTLEAGTYKIYGLAPGHFVSVHKSRLFNVTDGVAAITGSPVVSNPTSGSTTTSVLTGIITIASPKTFELQHRCAVTQMVVGFGIASSFGDDEAYSAITIEKLQ